MIKINVEELVENIVKETPRYAGAFVETSMWLGKINGWAIKITMTRDKEELEEYAWWRKEYANGKRNIISGKN